MLVLGVIAVIALSSLAYATVQYLKQEIRRTGKESRVNVSIDAPYGAIALSAGTAPGILAMYETDTKEDPQIHMRYSLSGATGLLKMIIGDDEGSLKERPLAIYHTSSPYSLAGISSANVIQSDYGYARVYGAQASASSTNSRSSIDAQGIESKVALTKEIPISLGADIGFGQSTLDLSGLLLQGARIETGASNTHITLRESNPAQMGLCEISAGVGECVADGLSYLNARKFDFNGGIGSYQLSFNGKLKQNMDAEISVGVGKVAINIPPEAGRVQVFYDDNFFSSCQLSGLTVKRDGYATSVGFDQSSAPILTLRLSTGLGKMIVSYR